MYVPRGHDGCYTGAMTNDPVQPTSDQIEHDCDPETDSDEFNHRYDAEGNVDPVEDDGEID